MFMLIINSVTTVNELYNLFSFICAAIYHFPVLIYEHYYFTPEGYIDVICTTSQFQLIFFLIYYIVLQFLLENHK